MAYTFSIKLCPYCNKAIDHNFKAGYGEGKLKIGQTEIYKCKHCGKAISNGLKEWPEMTNEEKSKEKLKLFFGRIATILLWGFGGAIAIWAFLGTSTSLSESLVVFIAILWFLIVALFNIYSSYQIIRESIERYNSNQNTSLSEIKIFDAKSLNISDDMKIIEQKINNLSGKINVLKNNMEVLIPDAPKNENASQLLMNLSDISDNFSILYDKYCAILLRLHFEQMSHYVNNQDINNLNIQDIVGKIDKNIKQIWNNLLNKIGREMPSDCREMNIFLSRFNKNMINLKIKLVALQSNKIISGISPISEGELINYFKFENDHFLDKNVINELNEEYDKYMAEVEVKNI